jgi:hypothetical protein
MARLTEFERRKPGANGRPIRLADGTYWLLATPTYCAHDTGLTRPLVDQLLDRLFDRIALGDGFAIEDICQVAKALLIANYTLSDADLTALLAISSGPDISAFVASVLEALFTSEHTDNTYTDWIRATLIANGLHATTISTHDLPNVLAILVATHRTVLLRHFADTCKAVHERTLLDTLV